MASGGRRFGATNYNWENQPSRWLAILRIYVGGWFLAVGLHHAFNNFQLDLPQRLTAYASQPLWSGYGYFLNYVILPNSVTMAWLLLISEIVIGSLYIFGFLTRLATMLALLVTINYLFIFGGLGTVYLGLIATIIIIELVLAGAAAGRIWGVDAKVHRYTLFKYVS